MVDTQKISLGRIRTAYGLNVHEAGVFISALARQGSIDLYEIWHEAVRFIALEENDKKSIYDNEEQDPYFPDMSDMGNGPLEGRILAKRLLRYFLYSARCNTQREYLQRIFERVLNFTYNEPDDKNVALVNHILDMIYAQRHFGYHGEDKVSINGEYVSPELFEKFCRFFDDAISANKEAAVFWLSEQGFSQERGVKGLSMELVRRILAAGVSPQVQTTPIPPSPIPTAIIVPRALWQGKEHTAVFAALRENKYADEVIAHVLFHWCNLKNKTEIGRLIIQAPKESSTYLHRVSGLLKKAAALNIITD